MSLMLYLQKDVTKIHGLMKKSLIFLKENSGKMFDPELIEIFLENINTMNSISQKFRQSILISGRLQLYYFSVQSELKFQNKKQFNTFFLACLLYTSDAADDTPCVDLGGRRIIKKKTSNNQN
eukprot:TRINITY_DN54923_c0_g1_i2.p1 TRINITY_DN54923_c0_g1~~TRINITY_DN54923_c0_g1_i2.p1  ORF type:complete len:123 (-),score=22.96 TRINITY_DN54923_c0_g1_i2:74-442(-)